MSSEPLPQPPEVSVQDLLQHDRREQRHEPKPSVDVTFVMRQDARTPRLG
jgi:hypothetical protein